MSCRPDLDVCSKNEFLAHINVGLKSEYEFENGNDCYEFISKQFGIDNNEDNCKNMLYHKKASNRFALRSKLRDSNLENRTENSLINRRSKKCLWVKENQKPSKIKEDTYPECRGIDDLDKTILDNITKASNYNQIEIIYDSDNTPEYKEKLNYLCYVCHNSFTSNAGRKSHLPLHFKQQTKLTTCPFCGKNFPTGKELNLHYTSHLTKTFTENSNKRCKFYVKIYSNKTKKVRK
ncbi:unnamed protein product [Phyllotreta striolata]|uniref:C2H2-type domain-containing protein n=1 Tax=Phyllotreta striolata TaxID=444603 RepID=A0A9N9TKX6_PHYSR|nr:unnamed protein product [Phyllotreta striolata]